MNIFVEIDKKCGQNYFFTFGILFKPGQIGIKGSGIKIRYDMRHEFFIFLFVSVLNVIYSE